MRLLIFFTAITLLSFVLNEKENNKRLKDFEVYKTAITFKESKCIGANQQLKENLNELKSNLWLANSEFDGFKAFSLSLAKLHSGHTQIRPSMDVYKAWLTQRRSLPFDYFLIGKRLISNKKHPKDVELTGQNKTAHQAKQTIPEFCEIISINNHTLPELMNEIAKYIPSDEDGIDFKYFRASQMFEFYRNLSFNKKADSIPVTYVDKTDTITKFFQLGAAPVHSINQRNKYFIHLEEDYNENKGDFRILNNTTAYFRFKSFNSSYGRTYERFLKNAFTNIKKSGIDKLIVDLRGNTGGAMQYSILKYFVNEGTFLGSYIVDHTKRAFESKYFVKLHPSYFQHSVISKLQTQQIKKGTFDNGAVYSEQLKVDLQYKGEIVVITDEGTFSSAAILACHLKSLANAKLIGRPAGGSFYSGNAGSLILKLPYSGNEILINPNKFTSHLKPSKSPQQIKQPEYKIESPIIPFQNEDNFYIKQALFFLAKKNSR